MNNKKRLKVGFFDFFNILVMIYLLLPIAIIILFSFNTSSTVVFPIQGFTTKWYRSLLQNELIIDGIQISVKVGLAVAVLSTVIGGMASFAFAKYQFKLKKVLLSSILIPITLPGIILGIALLIFFSTLGISRNIFTVILSHAVFCIPFAVILMNARLEGFDFLVEEAARDLGANTWQTFWYVIFPLIRSSVIGTLMITFALSFDEFLVTFFIIGRQNTLPLVIWAMMRYGFSPVVNALATIVLIFSMILVIVANKFTKMKAIL